MSTPLKDVRKIFRHEGIMKPSELALASARRIDPTATKFVVRLYDGFDHEWMDLTCPLDAEEARKEWSRRTDEGRKLPPRFGDTESRYDYLAIYPAKIKK